MLSAERKMGLHTGTPALLTCLKNGKPQVKENHLHSAIGHETAEIEIATQTTQQLTDRTSIIGEQYI